MLLNFFECRYTLPHIEIRDFKETCSEKLSNVAIFISQLSTNFTMGRLNGRIRNTRTLVVILRTVAARKSVCIGGGFIIPTEEFDDVTLDLHDDDM